MGITYGDFAEPLFRLLGAKTVESLDYSDYEQASIIHDMNTPLGDRLVEKFSVVMDGGTLEHVFNYPVAIRNCMDMVKVGGHLIVKTPSNNAFGHGFYQFSPELFFSLLNEENGFAETQIFQQDDSLRWFRVRNPKDIRRRVDWCVAEYAPSDLCVVSKKIKSTPGTLRVQQSDYVALWAKEATSLGSSGHKGGVIKSSVTKALKKIIPVTIKHLLKKRIARNRYKKIFYEKIDIGETIV